MLKIRSFLRLIKDSVTNLKGKILLRYRRHMAVIAYALSAAILVVYLGDLAGFHVNPSEYKADAATYEKADTKSEETITSDASAFDIKEYALNSPDNNILYNHITATVDETPDMIEHLLIGAIYPLGKLSISPAVIRFDEVAASMAILTMQQNLFLTEEEGNQKVELFAVNGNATAPKEETDTSVQDEITDTKETKVAKDKTKEVEAVAADIPAALSLKTNKNMIKTLSAEELTVLQRIVEAEATGEDIYGKILVANVVLNRVNHSEFPDTVSEVVFQKVGSAYQFSPTKDGRYYSVKITKSTKEAVSRALAGEDYSEGALYFFARKLTSERKANWFDSTLKKVVQYGCHEFYANR